MLIVRQQLTEYKSINIKETNTEWVEGLTISATEIYVYDKYYWRAVANGVTSEPNEESNEWVKWGISNKYAAIDERSTTTTVCDSDSIDPNIAPYTMVMEFDWNRYDMLAISEALASEITVELTTTDDPTYLNPIFTVTIDGEQRTCADSWHGYYYCPVGYVNAKTGLSTRVPAIIGIMRITFVQSTLHASCSVGIVYGGFGKFVGKTCYPFTTGLEDFSKHDTDEFGTTTLVRRASRALREFKVLVKRDEVLGVERFVKNELYGHVSLFIADENFTGEYNGLMTLGYLDSFSAPVTSLDNVELGFNIKEIL